MIKKALKWIGQKIWKYKFFFLSILFFCLTIHYGTGYYSQKKAAKGYKDKYEAVSGLFTPHASACPRPQPPRCPPQALPVQPVQPVATPRPAPAAHRESAPRQAEPPKNDDDALSEAAEAAEKAKREVLEEDLPAKEVVNPAINRRDKNGRLKPPPPRVNIIRIPKWLDK